MRTLVVGSGGREHALAWKIARSPRSEQVFCAPGNAGTAAIARNIALAISDHRALAEFAERERIDLTVVGPDDALAAGIADHFHARGLRIFGPTRDAARFESSKIFAKEFMARHCIPTARHGQFSNPDAARAFARRSSLPLVVKADGLALGKGVVIARTREEADAAIREMMVAGRFGESGKRVVIEEFLEGTECSIHALIDGASYLLLPAAKDHKTAFDDNLGPNTGGMGTFSPPPAFDAALERRVRTEILDRFMAGLAAEGIRFQGLLFPGLMLTADGPKVLEFNARFGDPETQSLLPRLRSDLLDLLEATVDGALARATPDWSPRSAVCVVMASRGYPGPYPKGLPITGIEEAEQDPDVSVFHAGTALADGLPVTAGGRVLGVTALGDTLDEARSRAYRAVERIRFDGAHFRRDIARVAPAH